MSVAALTDDLRPDVEVVKLENARTAVELLIELERGGAADAVALRLPEVEWDSYLGVGAFLGEVKRRTSWYIGDWLLHGQASFTERFSQAHVVTGLAEQTLLAYMFVCENVAPKRRRAGVPFSCHAKVARLEPKEQERWLAACEKHGWSYAELSDRMKAARRDTKPQIPGTEEPVPGEPDTGLLIEVGRAILSHARELDTDGSVVVIPREDLARLKAALGEE